MSNGLVSLLLILILALASSRSFAVALSFEGGNLVSSNFHSSISKLLKPFYCEKSSIVDVICDDNVSQISDIVKSLAMSFDSCTSLQINSLHNTSLVERRKRVFSLLVLKDFESFAQFMNRALSFNLNFNGYYSLIFIDIKSHNFEKVFALAWKHFMLNLNIMAFNERDNVSLFTYEPFGPGQCDNTRPVLRHVNESTPLIDIFPNKMNNLHKCPLRVPEINYFPATVFGVSSNVSTISGIEGDMLMAVRDALNFTVEVLADVKHERWGEFQN